MLTLEAYIQFYNERGYLPDGQYCSPNGLNKKQLGTKYTKYLRALERKAQKAITPSLHAQEIFEAEQEVATRVDPNYRDIDKGFFWSKLTADEKTYMLKKSSVFRNSDLEIIYDPAHIIGRGRSSKLAKDTDNIIMLPRYFHTFIDKYINPFTLKPLTSSEHEQLWIKIVGQERWDLLQSKLREE